MTETRHRRCDRSKGGVVVSSGLVGDERPESASLVAGVDGLDMSMPNMARMYDHCLGGKDNLQVDRDAVAEVEKRHPTIKLAARKNREFMHRATRYLVEERGIRQFLDIGTGIPTQPNLHQVAQEVAPETRVVYADSDPCVLAHARALLVGTSEGRTAYLQADVRDPQAILASVELNETLDLGRPVALSLVAVMHFVPGEPAYTTVATLIEALAPGSFLVMTHATADHASGMGGAVDIYNARSLVATTRNYSEFARFFAGLALVNPGITGPHRWNAAVPPPESMDAGVSVYAAVARKP